MKVLKSIWPEEEIIAMIARSLIVVCSKGISCGLSNEKIKSWVFFQLVSFSRYGSTTDNHKRYDMAEFRRGATCDVVAASSVPTVGDTDAWICIPSPQAR